VVRERGGVMVCKGVISWTVGGENSEHKSALGRESSRELGRDTVGIILEAKEKGLITKSLKGSFNSG